MRQLLGRHYATFEELRVMRRSRSASVARTRL
jgi:hypothetical protein